MKNSVLDTTSPTDIESARTTFNKLDGWRKDEALAEMLHLSKTYNWPGNIWWESVDEINKSIDDGYNPDNHFYFFSFDEGVAVKIS